MIKGIEIYSSNLFYDYVSLIIYLLLIKVINTGNTLTIRCWLKYYLYLYAKLLNKSNQIKVIYQFLMKNYGKCSFYELN